MTSIKKHEKAVRMGKSIIFYSILVGACAQSPASINPTPTTSIWKTAPCRDAQKEYEKLSKSIPRLVAHQNKAVTADAAGMFLIGVPVASASGKDVTDEIAITKGNLLNLRDRLDACGIPATPVNWK